MKPEELPAASQGPLAKLVEFVEHALNAEPSPHTRAVSQSSSPAGAPDVLDGGDLRAPSKPQFDYDAHTLRKLHQDVLRSTDGMVFAVIVVAERPDPAGKWAFQTKFVSRTEQQALAEARKPLDAEVERELARIGKD